MFFASHINGLSGVFCPNHLTSSLGYWCIILLRWRMCWSPLSWDIFMFHWWELKYVAVTLCRLPGYLNKVSCVTVALSVCSILCVWACMCIHLCMHVYQSLLDFCHYIYNHWSIIYKLCIWIYVCMKMMISFWLSTIRTLLWMYNKFCFNVSYMSTV